MQIITVKIKKNLTLRDKNSVAENSLRIKFDSTLFLGRGQNKEADVT